MEKPATTLPRPSRATRKPKRIAEIPDYLMYEEIDGRPVYYRGFRDVLNGKKTIDDIMGSSSLQGVFISMLLDFLYANLDKAQHYIVTNEIGLHLKKRTNLSSDIAIYDRAALKAATPNNRYFQIPPLAAIEVDTKADTLEVAQAFNWNYYNKKTQKLLGFGVKEVIWIFTETKQVMTASPESDWITSDWKRDISLLGKYHFSIDSLLRADGIINPDALSIDDEPPSSE
jgi:hypothetical protein